MDIVIRPPKPGDAEGLALAARDLAEQYAAREPERFQVPGRGAQVAALRTMLRAPLADHSIWLVAEAAGEAVGDAYAQLHEPMADAAVQPQRDVGRRRAYLNYQHEPRSNFGAVEFYERHGYEKQSVILRKHLR